MFELKATPHLVEKVEKWLSDNLKVGSHRWVRNTLQEDGSFTLLSEDVKTKYIKKYVTKALAEATKRNLSIDLIPYDEYKKKRTPLGIEPEKDLIIIFSVTFADTYFPDNHVQ